MAVCVIGQAKKMFCSENARICDERERPEGPEGGGWGGWGWAEGGWGWVGGGTRNAPRHLWAGDDKIASTPALTKQKISGSRKSRLIDEKCLSQTPMTSFK